MGLHFETSISAFTVLLQGLLSFFSPCVLPLIPVYISYLSGGARTVSENGSVQYKQKKILLNTAFFVLGISFAFFTLGLGFTVLGRFFGNNRLLLGRIGGVLVILFGLYQLGAFGNSKLLTQEHRLSFPIDQLAMGPFAALLLGFTFSFAWTPCVGPTLASVLLMASSAASWKGFLFIGIYTLGFVLPFLALGFFTGTLLNFFKKHQNIVKYTVKVGGILLIVMGFTMVTGWMNGVTEYLSDPGTDSGISSNENSSQISSETQENSENELPAAPNFTLSDQYGNQHTLSDYEGKTIFLNFWATWCPPCRAEMPEIQELYEEYGNNENDVVILGIAGPNMGKEGSSAEIAAFLEENNYHYPVLMDEGGSQFTAYGVRSFPTTFMIDQNGKVFGYVTGQLSKHIMKDIIQQTIEGKQP